MALTATIRRFSIQLSDVDRGVYTLLEFPIAQHPSESAGYAVARVLAFALEHREDIAFGRGISTPEDAAISAPGQHGTTALWIDIGAPSGDRLHKASKHADEVIVYTHKDPATLRQGWASQAIHHGDAIQLVGIEPALIQSLEEVLDRRNAWEVLRTDGALYVTVGEQTLSGNLTISTVHDP